MLPTVPCRRLELTLPTAAANIALDDALLRQVEEDGSGPVLRLWELETYAVVLGRANRLAKNVDVAACRADGVPIVRRCSGGGTVLLGPGALVFSLILPVAATAHLAHIEPTTAALLDRILTALRNQVAGLARQGTSDLAIGEGAAIKVSGNAQRWLRRTLLHHGTLLYNFDLDRISRYLTPPEREPAYRGGRPHGDFVTNLPLSAGALRQSLIDAWNATAPPPPVPTQRVENLLQERYANEEWTNRL